MAVVNLQPGNIMDVNAGQISGIAQVYRTNQGYDTPGTIGWVPNGGDLQEFPLAVGGHVAIAINGAAGVIANGCPSKVQVLYVEAQQAVAPKLTERIATKVIKTARKRNPAAVKDAATQAMGTLSSQWYNALTSNTTGLNLDRSTFQLTQSNSVIGQTSETLWNIFDAVPPLSVNNLFNPSQFNSFSSNYGSIISNLNQPGENTFQNDMGDYYSAWVAYLKTNPTLPAPGGPQGLAALFSNWSQINIPSPGQAMQCYTDLTNIAQGPVYSAIALWLGAGGSSSGKPKVYTTTVEQVANSVSKAPSGVVTMDSATESSNTSDTWAEGEAAGFFDIFGGEGDSSYQQFTSEVLTAGLTISAQFQHVVQIPAKPLMDMSTDPILSQYQPWYLPATLNLALQNDNNVIWKNNPPTWDNMFGANGSLLRTVSALVVVDGISITTTANTSVAISDQQSLKTEAEGGFWPFFEAETSGGWQNNLTFDSEGRMTYVATSPVGNPVILGVIVSPIAAAATLS